jgi:hypothetical protein
MTQQITSDKEQELLEILELVQEGEEKLREISEKTTELAQKCQCWYEQNTVRSRE